MAVHRTHVSTHDAEEAYAAMKEAFAVRQWALAGTEQFRFELQTTTVGPVTSEKTRITGATATQAVDFPVLRIDYLTAGHLAIDGAAGQLPHAEPVLLPPAGYTQHWAHPVVHSIAMDPAALTAHAQELSGDAAFRLRFTAHHPTTTAATRYLGATITHLSDMLDNQDAAASPILRNQVLRGLFTAVLHTFSNTLTETPPPAVPTGPVPAAVRRAAVYINTHLAEPIGIHQIAEAARLSPRGLQAAFRRHLDTTPTAYLRRARLDAAHHDLLTADPTAGATVAAIAARWGFAHPGRFAAAYHQAYGQTPTTTLHH